MIEGVSWSYPAPDEVYADPNVLRFAILEPGKPFKEKPASYWRPLQGSPELASQLATAAGVRSQNLTGFTLFYHIGKGWQMSVRRQNETGWDVGIIDDEKAQAVLSILEHSGHPDGPWIVKSSHAAPDRAVPSSMAPLAAHRKAQERLRAALAAWAGS